MPATTGFPQKDAQLHLKSEKPSLPPAPSAPPVPMTTGRNHPAFLNKLRSMVDDPTTNDMIRWSPSGKSIFICHPQRFADEILPRFFLHRRFSSFVRQLNMYGFHKVPHLQSGALVPVWSSTQQPTSSLSGSLPNTRTPAEEQQDNLAIQEFHAAGLPTAPRPVGKIRGSQVDEQELSEFMHEYFQRDQPDLMYLVVRKKPPPNPKKRTAKDDEPTFVELPDRGTAPPLPGPWGIPMGLLEPPPTQANATAPTPPPPASTALTPYHATLAPPGFPQGVFDAILASHGMQNNPAAAALLAATLTAQQTASGGTPATTETGTVQPGMVHGLTDSTGTGTSISSAGSTTDPVGGEYTFGQYTATPGPVPSSPRSSAAGLGGNVAGINLAAVLQTLQTRQNDLVREVAHLRSAQARLWQDRQEEKRKARKNHDTLQGILRFLAGLFGANSTPAILSSEDVGQAGMTQFSELGLDADLDQVHQPEWSGERRAKRPRTSDRESAASSPSSAANIHELYDTPAEDTGQGDATGLETGFPAAGSMFSPARRGLMIGGPVGWQPEGHVSPVGPPTEGQDTLGGAARFTRLGSPLGDGGGGQRVHTNAAQHSFACRCEGTHEVGSPRPRAVHSTPRLSSKQRADVMNALHTDQVSNWLAQLVNAAAPSGGMPPSPTAGKTSAASSELNRALNQTDAQAQAMQRSLAALAASLRQASQPQAAQAILDNQQAFAQGIAALQTPSLSNGNAFAHPPPILQPWTMPDGPMLSSPGTVPPAGVHATTNAWPSPPSLHTGPHTDQDDLAFANQFLAPDPLDMDPEQVPTPLPAEQHGEEDVFALPPSSAFA